MKQLKIRIFSDGKVQSTTEGIKGKACLNYLGVIEQLTQARAIDSDYTGEYYEGENYLCEDNFEERKLVTGD
jgi:hypothetical protein